MRGRGSWFYTRGRLLISLKTLGFWQYHRACARARGSWFRAWVWCDLSAIQNIWLIPCYHWIVEGSVQLSQLSLPLVSLVMFSMIHSKCYPPWYTEDSYDSLKIEIFRTLVRGWESSQDSIRIKWQLGWRWLNQIAANKRFYETWKLNKPHSPSKGSTELGWCSWNTVSHWRCTVRTR